MTLQELIEKELGFETRSYSGRSMFGRECLGVDVSRSQNMLKFAFDLGVACCENDVKEPNTILSDSMGLGSIIYFPQVPYVARETENDEEESNEI